MDTANDIPLSAFNFAEMRKHVLHTLSTQLPATLLYHSYEHTVNVETAVKEIAQHEGLNDMETKLVRTAALFHDLGFIHQHEHNEELAIRMVQTQLPQFNYSDSQIKLVQDMIHSTRAGFDVQNVYDRILSDADHDYFGRGDYFDIAERLRKEYQFYGREFSELEWVEFQLNYLELEHVYWTNWSVTNRSDKKHQNIVALKTKQEKIIHENLH